MPEPPAATPTSPAPADLDPAALARLERLGGPAFVLRLLALFQREAPARVDGVRASLGARDRDQLAYWSHSLISSSGNLGASRLRELARAVERDALAGHWDARPGLVAELETACARTRAALRRLVQETAVERRAAH